MTDRSMVRAICGEQLNYIKIANDFMLLGFNEMLVWSFVEERGGECIRP